MLILAPHPGATFVTQLDSRSRLVATMLLAVFIVLLRSPTAMVPACLGAGAVALGAHMCSPRLWKRLAALNVFTVFLLITIPVSTPGTAVLRAGALVWTREGLALAGAIAVKANSILLLTHTFLASMEPTELGHAMTRIGIPAKFAHIFLFMVRYLETVHLEYHRLRDAMRLRAFEPRCDLHSLRSLGYFLGMLLVRSMDRAERVADAMACRCFQGRFYLLSDSAFSRRDAVFAALCAVAIAILAWLEWGRTFG